MVSLNGYSSKEVLVNTKPGTVEVISSVNVSPYIIVLNVFASLLKINLILPIKSS